MRVLCVAEKPSISKSISQILSGGQFTTHATRTAFIKNYEFNYPQTNSIYTVTSVAGHLTASDFHETHRKWNSCDAFDLFDAPVESTVDKDKKAIEDNLLAQARHADTLMIWTDCDREGEHIGLEIVRVCRRAKRNIVVKRARFSAIIAQQIHHAAQHPVELDRAQAAAVEARIILDLKVGAAFTRMQTRILQDRFGQLAEGKNVVSYGPCQFPTLGFVVQKWNLVKSFVSEPFWYIYLSLIRNSNEETVFTWRRGHLFDAGVAIAIYDRVLSNPLACVTKVTNKSTKKWKPLPLTTVELQKAGSRLLKLAPKKVLDIAEKLYQQGFLSYPRTETDQFDPQFDFHTLIGKQSVDPAWGDFATSLGQGGFAPPRRGKNNDKAHPPIHPTAHAGNLAGDEKRVYEYITRRFLACCSKDAEGWETTVNVECGDESFYATGLVVLEKNYLLVYPYDKWVGHVVPEFEEGQEFQPSVCELRDGKTTKPNLLTEADLVTLMDKNGIGTDATIAQHIQMVIDRDYVIEQMEGATKYLIPSKLGIGLIEGYNQIGLNKSLSKPQLRRETERSMVQVCQGVKTKSDMLEETLSQYKEMFIITRREFEKVVSVRSLFIEAQASHKSFTQSVHRYLEGNGGNDEGSDDAPGGGGGNGRGRGNGNGRGRGGRGGRGQPARGRSASRGRGGGRGGGRSGQGADATDSDDGFDVPPAPPPPRGRTRIADPSSSREVGPSSSKVQSTKPQSRRASHTSTAMVVDDLQCDCGVPAAQRTVVKETASKGRLFWTCGNNNSCSLFKWVEDVPPAANTRPTIPAKRPYLTKQDSNTPTSERDRLCKCDVEAVQRTVAREGANLGRRFWTCTKGSETGCGFFEWDDELPQSRPPRSATGMVAGPSAASGACFKCGQEGHWANACPSDVDNGTKRYKSSASTANSTPSVTCYKCQQPGHYSAACPDSGKPTTSTVSSSGLTSGSCFKCGEEGHWSSNCPNDGAPNKPTSSARTSTVTRKGRGQGTKVSTSTKRGRGKKKSVFGAPDF